MSLREVLFKQKRVECVNFTNKVTYRSIEYTFVHSCFQCVFVLFNIYKTALGMHSHGVQRKKRDTLFCIV